MNEEDELATAHFQSKTATLLTPEDIEDEHDINIAFQKIFKSLTSIWEMEAIGPSNGYTKQRSVLQNIKL